MLVTLSNRTGGQRSWLFSCCWYTLKCSNLTSDLWVLFCVCGCGYVWVRLCVGVAVYLGCGSGCWEPASGAAGASEAPSHWAPLVLEVRVQVPAQSSSVWNRSCSCPQDLRRQMSHYGPMMSSCTFGVFPLHEHLCCSPL